MAQIDYLLVGHITADLVPGGRLLGGTVSYSAPVAQAFGNRVGLLTSAAACEPLLESLLPVAELSVHVAEKTTTFENIYHDGGRIQYVHSLAKHLQAGSIPVAWLDAPLVHLAPLVEEVDPAMAASFPNATVLLTPQGYLRRWDETGRVYFKRWLDQDMLKHVDIVVFSKQDIEAEPDLEQDFAAVTKNLIVTDSERGGIYYFEGKPSPYAPMPVAEVDPTGAGDVFAAALLSSLLKVGGNMQAALNGAAALAATSVTRRGAKPQFTEADIQHALNYANT